MNKCLFVLTRIALDKLCIQEGILMNKNIRIIFCFVAIFLTLVGCDDAKKDDSNSIVALLLASSQTSQTASLPEKRMFLTSTLYNGNLGGITGADQKCNSDSRKPSGSSNFKAYVFDGTVRSLSRNGSKYDLVDYPIAANTKYLTITGDSLGSTNATRSFSTDINDFFLMNRAKLAETNDEFWVGLMTVAFTSYTAEVRETCTGWTTNGAGVTGGYGFTNPNNTPPVTYLYNNTTRNCSMTRALLCVEQ